MTRTVVPIGLVDSPFDYGALESELANDLRLCAERIRGSIAKSIDAVIDIGNELLAAKERLDHGQFSRWVEDGVGIQARTARNYMNARLALSHKRETISHLRPAAVYQLAAPSTPPQVVDAVLSRVEDGEPMTDVVVAKIVRDARWQQQLIDRDAEACRRRTKKYKDEQHEVRQRQQEREAARQAAAMKVARNIHQRFGREDCIWLIEQIDPCPWDILSSLRQIFEDHTFGRSKGCQGDLGVNSGRRSIKLKWIVSIICPECVPPQPG
jgi:hypothetical protein